MQLELDPARFWFEPIAEFERWIWYGQVRVMRQQFEDPDCELTRQRAIAGATSLLRHQWNRMSAHERLHLLDAIEGRQR